MMTSGVVDCNSVGLRMRVQCGGCDRARGRGNKRHVVLHPSLPFTANEGDVTFASAVVSQVRACVCEREREREERRALIPICFGLRAVKSNWDCLVWAKPLAWSEHAWVHKGMTENKKNRERPIPARFG